uniref:Uncharacterized protein n=1 Tax=Meloidogyne incognita TaxID=6306 RepID=A0A914KK45_MELIC
MQDMALVMIEGCVICGNSSNQIITIKFIQLHPKGPIGNVCPENHENISTLELNLSKHNGFIVGGILNERLCPSRKSLSEEIEIAPLAYKHKFKIEIEHSCEGKEAKHAINFARELDLKDFKDQVFEMQGLSVHLTGNSTEETYDWEETWAETLIPIKVAELKTSTELVPTIETINKTTKTSNTPKEKETAHSTQPEIPDGPDFVELDGEQPGEEEEEENDQNKKDEIKQGETNVVEGIYLEETTHSVDEGKEEEENKNDEMNTSRPEEVSTKIEEINEEKENEYEKEEVNEKMEEKERKKEIKESKGSEEENESKPEKQDMSKDAFINS